MPNYQNGKIYKLICSETQKVYIGSTVQLLCKRRAHHTEPKNKCMSKHFINPKIYLIEKFPCDSKEELCKREREWIEKSDCVNRCIPTQSQTEWQKKNWERIYTERKANIKYMEKKKESDRNRGKEIVICECGMKVQKRALKRHQSRSIHTKGMLKGQ